MIVDTFPARLMGFCTGNGKVDCDAESHLATVGFRSGWIYYELLLNVGIECAFPTFVIDGEEFYFPIVACYAASGEVTQAKIDEMNAAFFGEAKAETTTPEMMTGG